MFLLDCAARRLTEGTLQFYQSKLSTFFRWCHQREIDALEEITAHAIRRFLVDIQRRQLSGQYQHNLARAIRAFLNYCVRDELCASSAEMGQMEARTKALTQFVDVVGELNLRSTRGQHLIE